MDSFHGLPLSIDGTDGTPYIITPYKATLENVHYLWEEAGKYRFMFSDFIENRREQFLNYFLSRGVVTVLVSEAETDRAVGIMYADEIKERHSARVHYFFWDKKQRTREPVILGVLSWFMREFDLNRVSIEIPWHVYSALRRVQAMGIWPEGIKRGAVRFNDEWRDLLVFGVLRDQLTSEAIKAGKIESAEGTEKWFGLLENETDLARAIFKRA